MTLAAATIIVASALTPPIVTAITASHAEFVDWARTSGHDGRIIDFLANREDGAGAIPRQWSQMSQAMKNADYQALRPDQKRGIAVSMIGQEAFDAYVAWARDRQDD